MGINLRRLFLEGKVNTLHPQEETVAPSIAFAFRIRCSFLSPGIIIFNPEFLTETHYSSLWTTLTLAICSSHSDIELADVLEFRMFILRSVGRMSPKTNLVPSKQPENAGTSSGQNIFAKLNLSYVVTSTSIIPCRKGGTKARRTARLLQV